MVVWSFRGKWGGDEIRKKLNIEEDGCGIVSNHALHLLARYVQWRFGR